MNRKLYTDVRTLLIIVMLFSCTHIYSQQEFIERGENLITDGIPEIPASIRDELKDYTESRSTNFCAWHPQRLEMIVATRATNTAQLFAIDGPLGKLNQLTSADEPVRSASFEPVNGNYFIFMKDTGGDEFVQMYRYDLPGGKIEALSSGEKVQTGFPVWSNKGDLIAYTSTKRNGADRDIYIMNPLDSASNKMLLERTGGGWGIRDWSPDDKFILISEFVSRTEAHYYLLEVETGKLTELTDSQSSKAYYSQGEFDAEGKGIYLVTDLNSNFKRVAYLEISKKEIRFISEDISWDVDEIEINKQCDRMMFSTNEAGETKIYKIDLPNGKPASLNLMPKSVSGNMKFHNDGIHISISINSAKSPTDVYVLNTSALEITQWTESQMGGINPEEVSIPELIKWNSFDGLEISGFLYKPSQKFTGKRPVIINIHGGPEGQSRPDYIGFSNYYVNELGIALIYPNVRGSTGFGKNFLELDNGMNRENSVKDIGALLDWIALQPDLDAERVMVTGGSYGGYMALAVSVHYTDRIKCAVDVVGISNFNTFLKNTESYRRDLRRVEYGDERIPEMYEFLEKISPLNNAQKIRNPILIVQGSNDPRVPRTEAEQMKNVIKENGGTVWYLEAKDEGHGFAKKNNADFQRYVTVMFVKEYLLGGG